MTSTSATTAKSGARRRHGAPLALTTQGRAALIEHLHRLYTHDIPQAHAVLWDHDHDARVALEFDRLCARAQHLQQVLNESVDLPDANDGDADGAQLGARVQVLLPDGDQPWVRLVHPEEAWIDDERVSIDSPLATALLAAKPGESVAVAGPAGRWTCRVIAVEPYRRGELAGQT